ncbi:aminodeoxychorismate/anthranilate synthase component II [Wohlfahrtiimonas larvae]|uniref:anthranilate synthase n=1 Tax=Wohlfahrtiimonas larvae TaxID=1157986 RepID=A0ABP9MYL8_9GAMM|nr:aminodeoxychorismate/anthranilate synthase component II [Wohlfahrtiimonas larvae]
MANIIFMDNFDSFTYNIVDDLRTMGHNVEIYRNNLSTEFFLEKLAQTENPLLFLSPGPCYPKDAGSMLDVIKASIGKYPMIGVCLGHQAIIETYGGRIIPADDYIHGETSNIQHDGQAMFKGLPNPMSVARYHSLVGVNIPKALTINASVNNMAMAVRDDQNYVMGFQFHPESILTTDGYCLLSQSIDWLMDFY